jgi:hypothetical protein
VLLVRGLVLGLLLGLLLPRRGEGGRKGAHKVVLLLGGWEG